MNTVTIPKLFSVSVYMSATHMALDQIIYALLKQEALLFSFSCTRSVPHKAKLALNIIQVFLCKKKRQADYLFGFHFRALILMHNSKHDYKLIRQEIEGYLILGLPLEKQFLFKKKNDRTLKSKTYSGRKRHQHKNKRYH